jgi:hypothetical protein
VSVAAHLVIAGAVTSVSLTTATVTVAAHSPGVVAGPITLAAASVSITAPSPGLHVSVALDVASVAIAAHTVAISHAVALHVATVTVEAYSPSVVITTPTLVASITTSPGTDAWGNIYLAGNSSYGPISAVSVNAGYIAFWTGSVSEGWTITNAVELNGLGGLSVGGESGPLLLNGSSIELNGQVISVPQSQPSSPEAAPSSYTQTWGVNITSVLNTIIATLADAGIW